MIPVSLYDEIEFSPSSGGGSVEVRVEADETLPGYCNVSSLPAEDNLVSRAARLLKAETGYPGGVRIVLRKRIPVGGGLGGGSADAAAVLRGLNSFWQLGCPVDRLVALGAKLGSDVPGLVAGGAVEIGGRGEIVEKLPVQDSGSRPLWMVIINPGFPVSTADIYSRYKRDLTSVEDLYKDVRSGLARGDAGKVAGGLFNGLQATVVRKYPLIGMILEWIKEAGAPGALLCGSGAAVFGLCSGEEHAKEVGVAVGARLGGVAWVKAVRTLPDGVMVAHGPLEA